MLDGGQQKWEAIEQVIRMDQSLVAEMAPVSLTAIFQRDASGDFKTMLPSSSTSKALLRAV